MPNGCTARIASATLSGVSPPASSTGRRAAMRRRALPIDGPARCRRAARGRAHRPAACTRAGHASSVASLRSIANALMTGRSMCSQHVDGLIAVQLHGAQPDARRDPVDQCAAADPRTRRRSSRTAAARATIARARSGSTNRGLFGQNTKPSAPAPSSTAASASSSRVMPQIFTSISFWRLEARTWRLRSQPPHPLSL